MARPKEAILSQSLIRDQALAIIDEDGLDALTMRRLATRLGVQAASLYTHFPNKDAVLEAIADRLARRIDPSDFGASWQAGLRTWATSFHAAVHWHPNAAPVVAGGSPGRTDHLVKADQVHEALLGYGWPARHATMVAAAARFLVLGAATTAGGDGPDGESPDRSGFTFALDALIDGLEAVHESVAGRGARRHAAG
ncbi:TetR family transcriptional regulator [Modestobacter sp. I12A-02628]|uniref:TetR family transcriptional regulator n=1 Tax=Goekera deserti TaxID=2497753 RepID=A0A7K3WG65_9ACTN|nr:TetR family transcriptional regulator [Goekera deserti]MPQ96482.1 TetR family transcriptional regulator [Goekera deserti]NDI47203.1 TetR family transcriptional regulator [Goekera deserti]NEL55397.1 TetR family transcriptional regulator [Goekera deserti]